MAESSNKIDGDFAPIDKIWITMADGKVIELFPVKPAKDEPINPDHTITIIL